MYPYEPAPRAGRRGGVTRLPRKRPASQSGRRLPSTRGAGNQRSSRVEPAMQLRSAPRLTRRPDLAGARALRSSMSVLRVMPSSRQGYGSAPPGLRFGRLSSHDRPAKAPLARPSVVSGHRLGNNRRARYACSRQRLLLEPRRRIDAGDGGYQIRMGVAPGAGGGAAGARLVGRGTLRRCDDCVARCAEKSRASLAVLPCCPWEKRVEDG